MATWTEAEKTALSNTIGDGVAMNTVLQAVQAAAVAGSQPKTLGAIRTRARNKKLGLDYRGSEVDGKFHNGVRRRQHTKKKLSTEQEESMIIVGEPRTTTNSSTPTTSVRTNENLTDVIVADNIMNGNRATLNAIYDDINKMLYEKYTLIQSITVELKNTTLTLSKDAS